MSNAYKDAGVDIHKGYESVELIKKHIKATKNLGSNDDFGGFGGLFNLFKYNFQEPVLVSGTDGVGTKLLLAIDNNRHNTIGIDLVAMCVNDVLTCGATPLFFLDYLAVEKNYPEKIEQLVKGIAEGCKISGCSLIGGETAEMSGLYEKDHYDMAGFVVGAVEKSKKIDNLKIEVGHKIIGLKSSGIHSNGYSLVRKIFKDNNIDPATEKYENGTLLDKIMLPTKIYVKPILALLEDIDVKGMAHITGGGFYENIPRILGNLGCNIYKNSWEKDGIFDFLSEKGKIEEDEMFNIFNMGIGYITVIEEKDCAKALEIIKAKGEEGFVIGEVTNTKGIKFI